MSDAFPRGDAMNNRTLETLSGSIVGVALLVGVPAFLLSLIVLPLAPILAHRGEISNMEAGLWMAAVAATVILPTLGWRLWTRERYWLAIGCAAPALIPACLVLYGHLGA